MTAMKKTNTKTKSPAPATSGAKSAKKKTASAPAAKSAAAIPASAAAKPAATASQTRPAPAPEVKAVSPAPVQTKIVVRIDVGYGNALYIRGDGPGLTWNQGVPMECVANDQWELALGESSRPISFKVLLNDQIWCTGPDAVVASGSTATVTPEFA